MKLTIFLFLLSSQTLNADAGDMLRKAIAAGDLAVMETLLSSGLNPNLPNQRGETPLNIAMQTGRIPAMELLLTWRADPNAPLISGYANPSAETPLHFAVRNRNLHMAFVLIVGGARIDATGREGRTLLHVAVDGGGLDMTQLLIEKGADPNARDAEGASPLDDAVWRGSLDVAAILLAHGAHLNDFDTKTGATPINEAAYRGNTPIVRFLLQFHPDLEIPDNRGFRPLDNAIAMGKEDSALLLLAAESKERQTPLFLEKSMEPAIRRNEPRVVETLVRLGASSNESLSSGATPLDAATSSGAIDVVRVLLQLGADPNRTGPNGASPLEDASLKGFPSIVDLLLDHGAQVDLLNAASGATALYAAASFGKSEVVALLLRRGANPRLCGTNRKTPYEAAQANGYRELALSIRSQGGAGACELPK